MIRANRFVRIRFESCATKSIVVFQTTPRGGGGAPKRGGGWGGGEPHKETPPPKTVCDQPSPWYVLPPPPHSISLGGVSKNGLQGAIFARFCFLVRFAPSPPPFSCAQVLVLSERDQNPPRICTSPVFEWGAMAQIKTTPKFVASRRGKTSACRKKHT